MKFRFLGHLLGAFFVATSAFGQAQIPSGTVMGNATAAQGQVVSVTPTAVISRHSCGTALGAQGTVLYFDGTKLNCLAPGIAGQLLKTGGASANPSWVSTASGLLAGSGITITGTTPATISLTAPVTVALGGTNAITASGASLDNITGFSSIGALTRTAAGTYAFRSLTAPAAGITVTNPDGVAGNPTLVLANDLAALEGLASTGIARRTATDAWSVGTAVDNSELATMAANTTKCNATAGTAVPTDCTAATMRTNIGSVIGTNVQAWDNDLDCLAALSTTGIIRRTGTGTCSAGTVALSDIATGTQDTVVGYFGSTSASALAINNCATALTYSTITHAFGCSTGGTGDVVGPSGAIANGFAVYNGTTGKIIKDYGSVVAVANGGTGDTGTSFSTYTPTVVCVTTTCTATGRYKQLGKQVMLTVTVTTSGSAGTISTISLPFSAANVTGAWVVTGRENAATGILWAGYIAPNASTIIPTNSSNAQNLSTGWVITFNGFYEVP